MGSEGVKRILLVEDNKGDQRLVAEALKEHAKKIRLDIVDDGDKAIEYLSLMSKRNKYPNLILLDLSLPRRNGKDVLQVLKANSALRKIPVVVFTSSELSHDINECYAAGANCYVSKQVGVQEYFQVIRRVYSFWLEMVRLPEKVDIELGEKR